MRKIHISRKHFLRSALTILVGAFIAWMVDTTNNSTNQTADKPTTLIQHSSDFETIEGIAFAVDGDSLKIDKTTNIRLLEIDAPEFSQKCLDKNGYEYRCGEISSNFLHKLINGKKITCKSPEKDIYKRYLAVCYLGEININQEIIKNGMAIIYDVKTASDEVIKLESEAKASKLGVWQGAFLEPKEYRKKNKKKNTE